MNIIFYFQIIYTIYKYNIISFSDINYDYIVLDKKTFDDNTIKKLNKLKIKYIK